MKRKSEIVEVLDDVLTPSRKEGTVIVDEEDCFSPEETERVLSHAELMEIGEAYPWDRLDRETDKQYAAFLQYIKLKPHQRSIKNAYRLVHNKPRATAASSLWFQWSSDNKWVERSIQYDRFQAKIERAMKIQEAHELKELRVGALEFAITKMVGLLQDVDQASLRDIGKTLVDASKELRVEVEGNPAKRVETVDLGRSESAKMQRLLDDGGSPQEIARQFEAMVRKKR
jgi:hypothetical protein